MLRHRGFGSPVGHSWKFALLLAACLVARWTLADAAAPVEERPWLDPQGVPGALVVVGGGEIPTEVRAKFVELAGGKEARLVIVPTANAAAGERQADDWLTPWNSFEMAACHVLHAENREQAEATERIDLLRSATAVWFEGGAQSRLAAIYLDTPIERELYELQKRGGVIGGTSAGAAIMSRVMIERGQSEPVISRGLDLLRDTIVDQHFTQRQRQDRLRKAIRMHPERVGVGIDESTALVVQGRDVRVLGKGTVTVMLASQDDKPAIELSLRGGQAADLTAWRRAARDSRVIDFPPPLPRSPVLTAGSLVIVGGGGMPEEVVRKFIELAGGPDELIVILPTAMPEPLSDRDRSTSLFTRFGARRVEVLTAREKNDVEAEASRKLLSEAKGVWFGGGRQWRFVDAYEGTQAMSLLRDVLARGGVIGGSSAGASIQAEYLVRGSPLGNTDMMALGYVRGFGFLPGTAIDQHFSQRNRFNDLAGVVRRHPQLLGIGIDEATALIVQPQGAEVLGRGSVHLCDGRQLREAKPEAADVVWHRFAQGERVDLEHLPATPADSQATGK